MYVKIISSQQNEKMRCWILFATVISLSLVGVRANERDHASLATSVSDENDANNFMEEAAADADDYLTDIQFDEDPRFNLTIPRSAIIAARRFTVPIPLMLDGKGINTSFRHCYCFKRLVRFGKLITAKNKHVLSTRHNF